MGESAPPGKTAKPSYPERDIDRVTSTVPEDPAKGSYWGSYKSHLEQQDQETFNLAERKIQLMTYYLRDPFTLKIMRDPTTGMRLIKGKGTMYELLQEVFVKAEEQYNRLNETRLQLVDLRDEHVRTIEDLNAQKHTLRERLLQIVDLDETIRQLEARLRTKPPIYKVVDMEPWSRIPERRQALVEFAP